MEKLKIFVSGTNDDMQPELDCISKALASVELAEGIRVEQAISRNESTSDRIIEQIEACSAYIGVFNHRYGRIIPGEDVSVTEFEFNRTSELRKPMLVWIRKLHDEESGLSEFDRQESFLKHVRESLRYKRTESDDLGDLEEWVASALRAAYMDSQLRTGLSFEKVLAERLFSDHWSEAIAMLAGINDRPVELVKWLSQEVERKNDWRRVLLVKRCWETSAASDDAEAQAAVIDALLVGFANGVSNEKGIAYRGIDPRVRRLSIHALASIGAPAVERLIDSLKVGLGVGAGAADALGMVGDPRAVEPLIAALADEERSDTRRSAATALGRFGDPRATLALFAALSDEDEDVGWAAADALGEIGDREVVEPLIELLEGHGEEFSWLVDSEPDEAEMEDLLLNAPFAAHLIGNPLALGSDHLKKLAAYTLGKLGDERAVEPLIANVKKHSDDEEVQWRAAEALGNIGDKRAVDPLVNALRDPEEDVRLSAVVALGKIGSRRALPELQRVARRDEGHWGRVAEAARQAIQKVKTKGRPRK